MTDTARSLVVDECPNHPGISVYDCRPCENARKDTRIRRQMAEAYDREFDRCDRGFPPRYRDAATDNPDVLAWVSEFVAEPERASSLLLLGPTGVGKTWQAYAALRAAATGITGAPGRIAGIGWIASTWADINAAMRPRPGVETEDVLERHRRCGLLLVDDLGVAKGSEWVEELTYRLINGRYEAMRPTIFTTNLALPALKDALGDRIASRLAESCTRIVLTGDDRRRKSGNGVTVLARTRPPAENEPRDPHDRWWEN